jgi:gamma-glutamylcyclotransferase (GGCT)/AIG2-like uncharacterized protein YtfP
VLSEGGDGFVFGDVVFIETPEITLELLDDYEGFGEDQDRPNLFIRKMVEIETANGKIECWAYLYNLSVEKARQITSGKY